MIEALEWVEGSANVTGVFVSMSSHSLVHVFIHSFIHLHCIIYFLIFFIDIFVCLFSGQTRYVMAAGHPNIKWIFKFYSEHGCIYSSFTSDTSKLFSCCLHQKNTGYHSISAITA